MRHAETRAMRPLLALLVLVALPGCFLNIREDDDPPPIANPCSAPAEPPQTLADGPYGSGVEKVLELAAYPSFKSDYPKRLVFDRATTSARIEYIHEDKTVVERWTVGPLTSPAEGECSRTGHERGDLTIASVTIDGVAGELSRYAGVRVTLMAGASVIYQHSDGRQATVTYQHGFSPIFTKPCPFRRPADGEACSETAICAYDLEGDRCTTRCGSNGWQSFACTK
jgi:hypothetical protein